MKIDPNTGLTSDKVKQLTEQGLSNVTVKNQSKSIGQIIFGNIFTYFNFIFAVFACMLILVRSYINMTFLPIIVINTLIGIIQEIRSKRVLDRLTVLHAPQSWVIRDGREQEVPSEELVKGDLCLFQAGNQICADAVICDGTVRVNEALVTGEADVITKTSGDVLLSGSFIVSGHCKGILENVGYESYAAKLTMEAKSSRKKQKTEMMQSLDRLVKGIGILIIPLGILMFCEHRFLIDSTTQESVVAVVASLVGMIPEGLYLLASVALVVSVMRLGKKKVIVHEMACVETLARVDVLCVDKTGTITENTMNVEEVVELQNVGEELLGSESSVIALLQQTVACLDDNNATMHALKEYCQEHIQGTKTIQKIEKTQKFQETQKIQKTQETSVCQFSSEFKYSGAMIAGQTCLIGAPENLLLDTYWEYQQQIEQYAKEGARVLIFGLSEGNQLGKALEHPVKPLAMIVLNNPLRNKARETFAYFQEQDVTVKVISGDNPVTVSNVALKAGIVNADRYIDARELKTVEKIREAANNYTVFGRVQPEQKRILIEAMKDAGRTVAMTGDGVNDVLALKKADCSIAMASGSEAACNAAQIVLLDSNFEAMPSVVLEGRRVINNIQRAASLFLVKNLFSLFLTFFTMVIFSVYPLYPTQLSLLGAFTIGAPAFFLALQPNKSRIKGNFLYNVIIKAMPSALTDFFAAAVLTLYGNYHNYELEQISTMTILCMLAVGIATLVRVCRPFDRLRAAVCICMITGIAFSLMFLRPIFAIYELTRHQIIVTVIVMAVSVLAFIGFCYLVHWVLEQYQNRVARRAARESRTR